MLSIKPILHQNRAILIIPYHLSWFDNKPASLRSTRPSWSVSHVPLPLLLVVGAVNDINEDQNLDTDIYVIKIIWNVDGKLDTPLLKGREALVGWWRRVSCRSRFVCASPRSTRMTSRSTAKNISLSKYINYSKSNKGLFKYQWFIMEQMKNNTEQLN